MTEAVPDPVVVAAPAPVLAEIASPAPAPDAAATLPVASETAAQALSPETPDSVLSAAAEPLAKPDEAKPDEVKADEAKAEEIPVEAAPPVPLTYEPFTFAEGIAVNEADLKPYTDVFGKHQVPQAAVQELLDLHTTQMAANTQRQLTAQRETWNATRRGWVDEFKADPEIGGNRRDTTLQQAGGAIERFGGTPDQQKALRAALSLTGAGDNPHVIRLLSNLGKALGEGRMVAAVQSKAPQAKSTSKSRYANSPSTGA